MSAEAPRPRGSRPRRPGVPPARLLGGLLAVCTAVPAASAGAQEQPPEDAALADPAIAAFEYGAGQPTVVVLHGGPGATHAYLLPAWTRLARRHRVVLYDQRGCGESGRGRSYAWPEHVEDLARLLDRLSPGDPVVLGGSSWGSLLALAFALEHPERVRALVLSGFPGWPGEVNPVDRPLPRRLRERLDSVQRGFAVGPPFRSDTVAATDAIPDDSVRALLQARLRVCEDVSRETSESLDTLPHLYELASLEAPVLILRGDRPREDSFPDASGLLAAVLPDARRVTLRGADEHDPWLAAPGTFFKVVEGFLDGVGSRGGP